MTSYARMERLLHWLDNHATSQPSLQEMAALTGLRESHFHREFVRWTGVTPKDFVKCLTLADAKERLVRGETVFEAAIESGLSGPGRLHDLCLSLEAASPGEIKLGGAGMEIRWGAASTPLGLCVLGESARGICLLSFVESGPGEESVRLIWPRAAWVRDDRFAEQRLSGIIATPERAKPVAPLRAWVKGSAFQVQVWRALLAIPEGSLTTYGHLAHVIGQPGAARAVGGAIGANPVAVLIPCHRVIRETGAISGYRWGVGRKRALLAVEGARLRNRL